MTRRSRAREVALQLLFQLDSNRRAQRKLIEALTRDRINDEPSATFCLSLVDGVTTHRPAIDKMLATAADNWRLHRMAIVDRNVLRLGVYEMMHMPDPTPAAVAIDEAIELARRFGSKDSPSFVNGILDKLYRQHLDEQARIEVPAVPVEATVTP